MLIRWLPRFVVIPRRQGPATVQGHVKSQTHMFLGEALGFYIASEYNYSYQWVKIKPHICFLAGSCLICRFMIHSP